MKTRKQTKGGMFSRAARPATALVRRGIATASRSAFPGAKTGVASFARQGAQMQLLTGFKPAFLVSHGQPPMRFASSKAGQTMQIKYTKDTFPYDKAKFTIVDIDNINTKSFKSVYIQLHKKWEIEGEGDFPSGTVPTNEIKNAFIKVFKEAERWDETIPIPVSNTVDVSTLTKVDPKDPAQEGKDADATIFPTASSTKKTIELLSKDIPLNDVKNEHLSLQATNLILTYGPLKHLNDLMIDFSNIGKLSKFFTQQRMKQPSLENLNVVNEALHSTIVSALEDTSFDVKKFMTLFTPVRVHNMKVGLLRIYCSASHPDAKRKAMNLFSSILTAVQIDAFTEKSLDHFLNILKTRDVTTAQKELDSINDAEVKLESNKKRNVLIGKEQRKDYNIQRELARAKLYGLGAVVLFILIYIGIFNTWDLRSQVLALERDVTSSNLFTKITNEVSILGDLIVDNFKMLKEKVVPKALNEIKTTTFETVKEKYASATQPYRPKTFGESLQRAYKSAENLFRGKNKTRKNINRS